MNDRPNDAPIPQETNKPESDICTIGRAMRVEQTKAMVKKALAKNNVPHRDIVDPLTGHEFCEIIAGDNAYVIDSGYHRFATSTNPGAPYTITFIKGEDPTAQLLAANIPEAYHYIWTELPNQE